MKNIQEQIDKELQSIECFEAALSELRSRQAEFERAADAVSDILTARYQLVQGLQALLKAKPEEPD
jgi:uncharacterized coiled-coil protein SlyX